ncbi:MAG: tRNA lysidine(34) synthetase TilS, partial [Gammaproteobacteria bacterium]|nr:tRNA lysidine(34) synthetase TilS [Gammaproteobacteria bacterium]
MGCAQCDHGDPCLGRGRGGGPGPLGNGARSLSGLHAGVSEERPGPSCELREAVAAVPSARTVALAWSGGLDSTVLLHAVATCGVGAAVRALHVNHALQPEADHWERHCRTVAARLGVAFEAIAAPVPPGNLEVGARRVRYRAWARVLGQDELLLLAHHADDQAETVLWQLATGRAPVGMPRERPLGRGGLHRPLLGVRKETLRAYAREHGLEWVEDASNADTTYDRNFLRHEILPRLEARYPGAAEALAASAGAWAVAPGGEPIRVAGLDRATLRRWLGAAVSDRCLDEVLRQAAARAGGTPRGPRGGGRTGRRVLERAAEVGRGGGAPRP